MNEQPQQIQIETLGRYKIIQRLGRGGMGEVWLCEDQRLNRKVAIKTLPAHNQQDKEFGRRFEHEAKAAASLNHPHILPVHDYGKQALPDETVLTYIVMPYINGGSLAERIAYYTRQKRLMPAEEAQTFLTQAAKAIDHAHKLRIIHRDIKPDNMLLRDENWLLLADFGIARMLGSSERLTIANQGFGTPEFMAPEQARGQATVTSDNYSLAVVAYLLLTGRLPFQGNTALATTIQHLTEPPPAPREINPFLSPACEQLLLQGLAKDPEQRPALALEFVTQLAGSLHNMTYQANALQTIRELPELGFKETSPVLWQHDDEKVPPLTRRQILRNGTIAAAACVGVGAGVWGISRNIAGATAMKLPAQPTVSARPTVIGPNKPVLVLTGHSQPPDALKWSPDSKILMSGGVDSQVLSWDITRLLQQPARPPQTPLYTNQLRCNSNSIFLAWSPDQSMLAVTNEAQQNNSTQVALCSPDLKVQSHFVLPYPPGAQSSDSTGLQGLVWPLKRFIVLTNLEATSPQSTAYLDQLYVVDTLQPQQHWRVDTEPRTGKDDFFSLGNNLLLSSLSSTGMVAVMHDTSVVIGQIDTIGNQASWQQRTKIDLLSAYTDANGIKKLSGACWSAHGTYIAGYSLDANVLIYTRWQEGSSPMPQYKLSVPANADGSKTVLTSMVSNPASLSPGFATGTIDGGVYLWNFQQNSQPVRKLDNNGITQAVVALDWSPDGHWLAASFRDQNTSILVWKLS